MDQNIILGKLREFRQGNKRRFLSPEYSDMIWIGRQCWHRLFAKVESVSWFGNHEPHLAMQSPIDLMAYQECLVKKRPRVLIETGTLAGECTLFFDDILRRIWGKGNFRIITIELMEKHINDSSNLKRFLEEQEKDVNEKGGKKELISIIGDSTDPGIISEVRRLAQEFGGPISVTFDSDHGAETVAKELAAYSDLVSPGQYLIVQDTYLGLYCCRQNIDDYNNMDYKDSPLGAVEVFLELDNSFEIDLYPQRWIIIQSPFGFLLKK